MERLNKSDMKFTVKVITRSSKNEVIGESNGILKVKLISVPEKGKANNDLIDLLSNHFEVKKDQIKIVRGWTNNIKLIEIS